MQHASLMLTAAMSAMGLAAGAGAAADDAGDPRVEELTQLVNELRGEVAALRARTGDGTMDEQRAAELRGLVEDVLSDADSRTSTLQSGISAGHDGHFFIASADGAFRLELSGQLQIRWTWNMREDSGADDNVSGFENRRTKLAFEGHVVDESWQYLIQGAFSDDGGAFGLEIGTITKDLGNGWSITAGQFKPPFLREELVSSKRQLAVDRSLVNERFNQDFAQGVEVSYEADAFRAMAMYHDGLGNGVSAPTGGRNQPWNVTDTEFAFAARGEVLLSGAWKQFADFTSWRGGETGVMIGGAVNYEKGESGTAAGPEETDLRLSADVSAEFDGANLFAAFVYQDLDVAAISPWAFVVQGGLFVTDDIEAFARYEFGDADSAGIEDLNVITVGVNKYWSKHNVKWTTDVGFALDEVQAFWDADGVGWLTDGAGQDGQVVVRSQLQLLF